MFNYIALDYSIVVVVVVVVLKIAERTLTQSKWCHYFNNECN